jgi:hypothetical protein
MSMHASGEENPLDNDLPNLKPEQENCKTFMIEMLKRFEGLFTKDVLLVA